MLGLTKALWIELSRLLLLATQDMYRYAWLSRTPYELQNAPKYASNHLLYAVLTRAQQMRQEAVHHMSRPS